MKLRNWAFKPTHFLAPKSLSTSQQPLWRWRSPWFIWSSSAAPDRPAAHQESSSWSCSCSQRIIPLCQVEQKDCAGMETDALRFRESERCLGSTGSQPTGGAVFYFLCWSHLSLVDDNRHSCWLRPLSLFSIMLEDCINLEMGCQQWTPPAVPWRSGNVSYRSSFLVQKIEIKTVSSYVGGGYRANCSSHPRFFQITLHFLSTTSHPGKTNFLSGFTKWIIKTWCFLDVSHVAAGNTLSVKG